MKHVIRRMRAYPTRILYSNLIMSILFLNEIYRGAQRLFTCAAQVPCPRHWDSRSSTSACHGPWRMYKYLSLCVFVVRLNK